MTKRVLLIISACWVLACILYLFMIRYWVFLIYDDAAPRFFTSFINELYPRFAVEKHRFPLEFFLRKADQIFLRGSFVFFLVWVAFLSRKHKIWTKFGKQQVSTPHAHLLRLLFYIGLLYYTWDWVVDLQRLSALQAFYKPVLLFKLLHFPLPPFGVFVGMYVLYVLFLLFAIFRIKPVLSSFVVALLLVVMHGYFLSFEKIGHGYVPLMYAALLMPFFLMETQSQKNDKVMMSWSLPVIQAAIAGTYFFAGLEKLFTSGFSWVSARTFRTYLELHQTPLGLQVAENDLLCVLLPLFAIFFQLGFVLVLFFPKLRYIFLPGGIAFHAGTVLLFSIGAYFSPWVFVYIFFINWGWCIDKTSTFLPGIQPRSQTY